MVTMQSLEFRFRVQVSEKLSKFLEGWQSFIHRAGSKTQAN